MDSALLQRCSAAEQLVACILALMPTFMLSTPLTTCAQTPHLSGGQRAAPNCCLRSLCKRKLSQRCSNTRPCHLTGRSLQASPQA